MSIMTTENGISIAGGGQGGGQSESTGDKSGVINLADKVGIRSNLPRLSQIGSD